MKKQISEEINSMKFLLNYKRGVVISEQTNNAEDVGIIMRELDKTNSDESNIVNIIKKIVHLFFYSIEYSLCVRYCSLSDT